MKPEDRFLLDCQQAAKDAGHPFPEYAACEAALESAWGKSLLARSALNLFGQKQSRTPIFETIKMPTHEYVKGQMVPVMAEWVKFPDLAACFKSRIDTVRRLAANHVYSGYADSLLAENGEDWVRAVSRNWSTDPLRADKVLAIYAHHKDVFPA